jgi:hypothetical protein
MAAGVHHWKWDPERVKRNMDENFTALSQITDNDAPMDKVMPVIVDKSDLQAACKLRKITFTGSSNVKQLEESLQKYCDIQMPAFGFHIS